MSLRHFFSHHIIKLPHCNGKCGTTTKKAAPQRKNSAHHHKNDALQYKTSHHDACKLFRIISKMFRAIDKAICKFATLRLNIFSQLHDFVSINSLFVARNDKMSVFTYKI